MGTVVTSESCGIKRVQKRYTSTIFAVLYCRVRWFLTEGFNGIQIKIIIVGVFWNKIIDVVLCLKIVLCASR